MTWKSDLDCSRYPSGRDHQLRQPQVGAASSLGSFRRGGSGGSGGSSTCGVGDGDGASGVGSCRSSLSTAPSDETLSLVMAAGMASPLLDLRFVKNLAGDWSFALSEASLGSSEAAPPLTLTPMLSLAVFTVAVAFDRQLPPPPSHLRLGFLCSVPLFSDAWEVGMESALSAAASGLGLDFLRGLIPACRLAG